tara:strand:+ start:5290 stop:5496 length:207 start_codon:yes stop_codon:yes gene_type:complete
LLNSVRKLDKINDIEVNLEGDINEIIEDPIAWGEKQVEKIILQYQDKYFESKKLGEDFWNEVRDKSRG